MLRFRVYEVGRLSTERPKVSSALFDGEWFTIRTTLTKLRRRNPMTNVNVTAGRLAELGGATNSGVKIGFVDSGAKAAQNDTWTVSNATTVLAAFVADDSAGTLDAVTISGNVLTLTGAATGATSGLIIFK